MSSFDILEYLKTSKITPYNPAPYPYIRVEEEEATANEMIEAFGDSFIDSSIIFQGLNKLRGTHYTDEIARARHSGKQENNEFVGPQLPYNPFADTVLQNLPDEWRKHIGSIQSKTEGMAYANAVYSRLGDLKKRAKSPFLEMSGMVMGEILNPGSLYAFKHLKTLKDISKGTLAIAGDEIIQHQLQPERSVTGSAIGVGAFAGITSIIAVPSQIATFLTSRSVPMQFGDIVQYTSKNLEDGVMNYNASKGNIDIEIIDDFNPTAKNNLDIKLIEDKTSQVKLMEDKTSQTKLVGSQTIDEAPIESDLPPFEFIGETDPVLKKAPERATSPSEDTIAPAFGLEKLPDGPVKRILYNGSNYAKSMISHLVEHPFVQLRNLGANPGATPTGIDRKVAMNWLSPMVKTMRETEQLYLQYRHRMSQSQSKTITGQAIKDIMRGRGDAIGFDEFLEQVGKHKRGADNLADDIHEIKQASDLWHTRIYKPMGEEAQKIGMFSQTLRRELIKKSSELRKAVKSGSEKEVEKLQSRIDFLKEKIKEADTFKMKPTFLNRIYKKDLIRSRREEFIKILMKHGRNNEESNKITDSILGQNARDADIDIDGPVIEMDSDNIVGRASSLRERSIGEIPDAELGEFLEHNIFAVGKYYTTRVGPDVELTKTFGSIDMYEQIRIIKKSWETKIASVSDLEKPKLTKKMNQELEDIKVVRDKIRGTYGLPDDPDAWTNRSLRVAKMFNATTLLTGAISAVPDLGRLIMYDGMVRTFGTSFDALTGNLNAIKLAREEAELAGEALDMYMSMRAALFTDLSDAMSSTSQFERIAAKGTQQFFNVSLMNPWNVGVKTMASLITGSRILEESLKWSSGLRNSASVPVKYGEVISPRTGNRIAASYNNKTKEITLDLDMLREKWEAKVWVNPSKGIDPLPEKQFKKFEDWRDFVLEHELAHTDFRPNKGESLVAYENRINQIALKRVGVRGKPSAEFQQSKLAQSGIDADMAGRIAVQFEQYGVREGRVMIAKTSSWTDRKAAKAFTAALGKDINTIIVTPGKGDLPNMMSGGLNRLNKERRINLEAKEAQGIPLTRMEQLEKTFMGPQVAQLIFQFKSFGASATQRVLVPGLQRPDRNFLLGAAGLIALGVMVDSIRTWQLDSKRKKSTASMLKSGIDRSGILGWISDANGSVETLTDGRFGIGPLLGEHGYSRSLSDKVGAVGGPIVSSGRNLYRLAYGLSDGSMDSSDAYYLKRALPLNRTFWADGVFDLGQHAIAGAN